MHRFVLLGSLIILPAVNLNADEGVTFYTHPSPSIMLADANAQRKVVMLQFHEVKKVRQEIPTTPEEFAANGKKTKFVMSSYRETGIQTVPFAHIKVQTAGGKKLAADSLAALKRKLVVVVPADSQVHADYLKLLSPDTLIIVLKPAPTDAAAAK